MGVLYIDGVTTAVDVRGLVTVTVTVFIVLVVEVRDIVTVAVTVSVKVVVGAMVAVTVRVLVTTRGMVVTVTMSINIIDCVGVVVVCTRVAVV